MMLVRIGYDDWGDKEKSCILGEMIVIDKKMLMVLGRI